MPRSGAGPVTCRASTALERGVSRGAAQCGRRAVPWSTGANTISGFGARPTAGGVHLDGWKELDIEVYYGAYNRAVKTNNGAGSFRAFTVGYVDHRDDVVKPDNRPTAIRAADRETISLATFGADYVHVLDGGKSGKFDMLGWIATQTGSWGSCRSGRARRSANSGGNR